MPRTLTQKPHGFLRLASAVRAAGMGALEDLLPRWIEEEGWSLRAIRNHLIQKLPNVPVPTTPTIGDYYRLIIEDKEEK